MTSPQSKSRSVIWLALLITALGLALRLFRMTWEGPWYDENFTLAISNMQLPQMIREIVIDVVHPPLHYLALHFWFAAFGYGEAQARLLSVVFGTASIPVMFLLGRKVFDRATGLVAALLLAISQMAVYYSVEIRMYSMAIFWMLCALLFFVKAIRSARALWWMLFVASAALMLYSHYYTVFVLIALVLWGLLYRQTSGVPARWWIGGGVAIMLALAPWLASGVVESAKSRRVPRNTRLMAVHWFSTPSSLNWLNNGKWNGLGRETPKWTLALGMAAFTLPSFLPFLAFSNRFRRWYSPPEDRESVVLLGLAWMVPVVAIIEGARLTGIQFIPRYVIIGLPAYYLMVARGITGIRPPVVRAATAAAALLLSVGGLRANYTIRSRDQSREVLGILVAQYRDSDCVCLVPGPATTGNWYWRARPDVSSRIPTRELPEVLADPGSCPTLWVLWDQLVFRTRRRQTEPPVITRTIESRFERVASHDLAGCSLHQWRPKPPPAKPAMSK